MSIQWGRVLLAAFLMELVLIAIAIPLTLSGAGGALVYVIPPASFAATFAITVWLGRRFTSRPVLHGGLIGIAGSLMYVALTRGAPEPWSYLLAHILKIAGGDVPPDLSSVLV
jgi:zinc transporter ZupT